MVQTHGRYPAIETSREWITLELTRVADKRHKGFPIKLVWWVNNDMNDNTRLNKRQGHVNSYLQKTRFSMCKTRTNAK